jgi:prolyl-tRNA editing enzyme YbaK/EbsC (Cys-tRNA(Pro) deacylase)
VRTSVDVANFLVEREVPHEVFSASGRLRSPERMAAVLDLPPEEVGRVVLFEGPAGPVAAVVPCEAEPDPVLVARAAGQPSVEPADDDRAAELTGYLAESIPPVGLPKGIRLVIDPSLDRDDVVYFPGGEVRAVLKVRGRDLVRATGARVCPIVFRWPGA